jgi:hypothetical protein
MAVIQLGDGIAARQGQALGFYVGSLFVWIIWLAWLVTWRWTGARRAQAPAARLTAIQVGLALFGLLWLGATVLEYL